MQDLDTQSNRSGYWFHPSPLTSIPPRNPQGVGGEGPFLQPSPSVAATKAAACIERERERHACSRGRRRRERQRGARVLERGREREDRERPTASPSLWRETRSDQSEASYLDKERISAFLSPLSRRLLPPLLPRERTPSPIRRTCRKSSPAIARSGRGGPSRCHWLDLRCHLVSSSFLL